MNTLDLAEIDGDVPAFSGSNVPGKRSLGQRSPSVFVLVAHELSQKTTRGRDRQGQTHCEKSRWDLSLEETCTRDGVIRLGVLRAATLEQDSGSFFACSFLGHRAGALLLLLLVSKWSSERRVFFLLER